MAMKPAGRFLVGAVVVAAAIGGLKYGRDAGMFKSETPPPATAEPAPVAAPAPVAQPTPAPAEQPKLVEPASSDNAGLSRLLEQGKK